MEIKNILLIQPKRIGDVLFTTPAIRTIRERYPNAKIDFITEKPSLELFANNPYINNVICYTISSYTKAIKLGLKLRKVKYDVVIDFYSHPLTAVLSRFTGAKIRIAVSKGMRDKFYTHPVKVDYSKPYGVYHKLQLLEPLGIFTDDCKMDFFVSDEDKKYAKETLQKLGVKREDLFITVSPVSRRGYKVWPAERFAKVCDYLISKHNAKVMINYGPNEEEFAEAVRTKMKEKPLDDIKVFSISKLKAIYELANLNISNDNGPCHFAVASGIKVITIYGKPSGASWSPINDNVIFFDKDMPCKQHCTYPNCALACLTATTAEMIIEASERLLGVKTKN